MLRSMSGLHIILDEILRSLHQSLHLRNTTRILQGGPGIISKPLEQLLKVPKIADNVSRKRRMMLAVYLVFALDVFALLALI